MNSHFLATTIKSILQLFNVAFRFADWEMQKKKWKRSQKNFELNISMLEFYDREGFMIRWLCYISISVNRTIYKPFFIFSREIYYQFISKKAKICHTYRLNYCMFYRDNEFYLINIIRQKLKNHLKFFFINLI